MAPETAWRSRCEPQPTSHLSHNQNHPSMPSKPLQVLKSANKSKLPEVTHNPEMSHNRNPVLKWSIPRTMLQADIRSYSWQGDCPLLTFFCPGFDCGSLDPETPRNREPPLGTPLGTHNLPLGFTFWGHEPKNWRTKTETRQDIRLRTCLPISSFCGEGRNYHAGAFRFRANRRGNSKHRTGANMQETPWACCQG